MTQCKVISLIVDKVAFRTPGEVMKEVIKSFVIS